MLLAALLCLPLLTQLTLKGPQFLWAFAALSSIYFSALLTLLTLLTLWGTFSTFSISLISLISVISST